MGAEETKHDLWLKRVQVTVAILAGLATMIIAVANFLSKKAADEAAARRVIEEKQVKKQEPSALRSAIEETGASWIRSLKKDAEQTGE